MLVSKLSTLLKGAGRSFGLVQLRVNPSYCIMLFIKWFNWLDDNEEQTVRNAGFFDLMTNHPYPHSSTTALLVKKTSPSKPLLEDEIDFQVLSFKNKLQWIDKIGFLFVWTIWKHISIVKDALLLYDIVQTRTVPQLDKIRIKAFSSII